MGLAGPRKRVKLSHDPNNTKWTRDTAGFGHKIMTAQGWQPGDILGAKNASHAEFHTAANASHIRVFVKDDNLGLGAKKGSGLGEGECTGLDVFQSLLGRLNGRDETELLREQNSRDDLKRTIYTEQRWGTVRFVKGGFLVGDKIQELIENEEGRLRRLAETPSKAVIGAQIDAEDSCSEPEGTRKPTSRGEKKKKKKRRKVEGIEDGSTKVDLLQLKKLNHRTSLGQDNAHGPVPATIKKSKKKRKSCENAVGHLDLPVPDEIPRIKKSKKKNGKEASLPPTELVNNNAKSDNKSTSQSPPTTPGSSTPQSLLSGRHAVRSRNIAQKRLAVLDIASLNQIFMIKQ